MSEDIFRVVVHNNDDSPTASQPNAHHVMSHRCHSCAQTYGSKGALKRHENSHSLHVKHVCPFCSLGFHRRDLLARHRRIHTPSDAIHGQDNGRQRSAIACDNCRKGKRKCDGDTPCKLCGRWDRPCHYTQRPNRLSLPTPRSPTVNHDSILCAPSAFSATSVQLPPVPDTLLNASDTAPSPSSEAEETTLPLSSSADKPPDVPMSPATAFGGVVESNAWGTEYPYFSVQPWQDQITASAGPQHALVSSSAVQQGLPDQPLASSWTSPTTLGRSPGVDEGSDGLVLSPHLQSSLPVHRCETAENNSTNSIQSENRNLNVDARYAGELFSAEKHQLQLQKVIIDSQIDFALNNSFLPLAYDRITRAHFRSIASKRAECAFDLDLIMVGQGCSTAMDVLISSYFQCFHPRRPIFWQQGFDSYGVSSVIVLSMVSVGCTFAGQQARRYGASLHDRLSATFIDWFSRGVNPDQGFLFLIFGLLTETTELLLHPNRSSGARELHRILVSHTRSLGAFVDASLRALSIRGFLEYMAIPDQKSQWWLEHEMKKRIVLSIVQNDLYLSQRYSTPPLIAPREVELSLLCPDEIWTYTGHDWSNRFIEAANRATSDDGG